MTLLEANRFHVSRLLRANPFQPFALNLQNGDRILIEHPENIAFDPTENGREDFHVLTAKMQYFSAFTAVTSVARLDDERISA